MSVLSEMAVLKVLDSIIDPHTQKGLAASERVKALVIKDGEIGFMLEVPEALAKDYIPVRDVAEAALLALEGVTKARVVLTAEVTSPKPEAPKTAHISQRAKSEGRPPAPVATTRPEHVKRVIVVGSGKGGVGKSTLSLNLALGLKALGLKVGLLDADIYGPSVPIMTGITQSPATDKDKFMIPHEAFGIKFNSIGYLVGGDQAMIWRAPMATQAITQLLMQTRWGTFWAPLDVLIVDLPPGTGDIQLTLSQKTLIDGAVVVSTPQDMALADAKRALSLFEKTNIKVLGIIENMAFFKAPDGSEHEIFGRGGAKAVAETAQVAFLGEVPLDPTLRAATDLATPLDAKSDMSKRFKDMAMVIKKALF
jgi:ATP-binding protein involved in chromosome partitioning